LSIKDLMMII